jgi:hypothetical protein
MNGKTILGLGDDFSYGKDANLLYFDKINGCHLKLYIQGYRFAGWHGTRKEVCEKLINGAKVKPTEFTEDDKKIWTGFYVFNRADRAIGYCEGNDFALVRAYLLLAQVRDIIVASHDINEALLLKDIDGLRGGAGRYVISGPDNPEEPGHEMVISRELLPKLVFLPSLHTVKYECLQPWLIPDTDEALCVHPRIDQRGNSIRGE